jgi:hypothetical protein
MRKSHSIGLNNLGDALQFNSGRPSALRGATPTIGLLAFATAKWHTTEVQLGTLDAEDCDIVLRTDQVPEQLKFWFILDVMSHCPLLGFGKPILAWQDMIPFEISIGPS